MNDEMYMDEEKIKEIEECFKMFDKDKDGYVSIKELELIFRSLGYSYTEFELTEFIKDSKELKYNKNNDCMISYSLFESIIKLNLKDTDLEEELNCAFSNFIKDDRGLIPISEFKHIMTSLGDRLSEEEVDEMAKDADPKGIGMVDCREFIKLLVSK